MRRIVDEVRADLRDAVREDEGALEQLDRARELFERVSLDDDFIDFLSLPAYEKYFD